MQVIGSRIQDEAGKVGFGQVTKGPDDHPKVPGVRFAGHGKTQKDFEQEVPGEIGALEESLAGWVMDGWGRRLCQQQDRGTRGRGLRDLPEVTKALMAARERGLGSSEAAVRGGGRPVGG